MCLGVIYGITRIPKGAMAFPIFILLLVPLRFLLLPCFFQRAHLQILDGDEDASASREEAKESPRENRHEMTVI